MRSDEANVPRFLTAFYHLGRFSSFFEILQVSHYLLSDSRPLKKYSLNLHVVTCEQNHLKYDCVSIRLLSSYYSMITHLNLQFASSGSFCV